MTAPVPARPTLQVVEGPTPHPGGRPLEFIRWAVDEFGAPGQLPGTVVIERSQRELALANDEVDSAGTVAYYVSKLRTAGVVLRTVPIVVDVDAMDRLTNNVSSTHLEDERRPPRARPLPDPAAASLPGADLVALLIREAELEAELAQVRADASAARASNLRAALLTPQDLREPAKPGLAQSAGDRARRECGSRERKEVGVPSLEIDQPPTFLERDSASEDSRTRADHSRTRADHSRTNDEALPFEDVDEIIAPLIEWCRANNRETFFNDQGREVFSRFSRDGLQHAVQVAISEAAADPTIRSPLGRMFHQATSGNTDRFTPWPVIAPAVRERCADCGGSGLRDIRSEGIGTVVSCGCRTASAR